MLTILHLSDKSEDFSAVSSVSFCLLLAYHAELASQFENIAPYDDKVSPTALDAKNAGILPLNY